MTFGSSARFMGIPRPLAIPAIYVAGEVHPTGNV